MTPIETERRQVVALEIRDPLLRVAARGLLMQDDFIVASHDDGRVRLITDDSRRVSRRAVLFVDDSAAGARHAVEALGEGRLGAFLSKREPESLTKVLRVLDSGMASASNRVIFQAISAPKLVWRQERILSMVIDGKSNAHIAGRLGLSEATVKREVSVLMKVFAIQSRVELAMKASAVGYAAS